MCHHTTIHKAAHLSPIGLMGPVRTGPYFLALANILHPYRVGARGCSGHRLLKTQKRSKSLLSNFLKSGFSEVHTQHSPGPTSMRVLAADWLPSGLCGQLDRSYAEPVGILARVPHTRTWPEALEGIMMPPGAGFFFMACLSLLSSRWEGRESRLQSVTKGRCSPPPPLRPFIRPPGSLCTTTTSRV